MDGRTERLLRDEVSTIFFTGSTRERTMFRDAGFKLNSSSGRVFTEGAPDTVEKQKSILIG